MGELQMGRIADWDEKRGFGFVDQNGRRVFLHIREFVDPHHFPRTGDRVSFLFGQDEKGRVCAKAVRSISVSTRLCARHFFILLALLILPLLAAMKLPFDLWIIGASAMILSGISWFQYSIDKRRAKQQVWRISESRLHFWDFIGGWPGGYLAQRHLRHKTSKGSFQFVFWSIVVLYQLVSFDYLGDWACWNLFRQTLEPLR